MIMKKNLLFIISLLLVSLWAYADDGVTIYGYRNYQSGMPTGFVSGPVKFLSNDPGNVTLIQDQTSLGRIYAGEYRNYKWYATTTKVGTQTSPENLVEIDMITGERKVIAPASRQLYDLTYDYSTGIMYGILSQGEALATIDLATGVVTKVADLPPTGENYVYAAAIACDLDGELYMVSFNDNLYKLSKTDGTYELIGALGVNSAFTQTMGFDHNTGILYWVNAGDTRLYTINITTGAATLIGDLGQYQDNLSSLFIPFINVASGTPDRVINRNAQPDTDGEIELTLSWTNPTNDAQGNPLSGDIDVYIYINDIETKVLTDRIPGGQESIVLDEQDITAGLHSIRIICENENGFGGVDDDDLMVRVGEDVPGPVLNFQVASGDNKAILSWEKPVVGGSNGHFDPVSLTGYIIYRSGTVDPIMEINDPDLLTYEDIVPEWGKYTYSIKAINNVGEGTSASSAQVLIKPDDWIIMAEGTYTVSGGTFYDDGGPDRNYTNSQKITMTLIPEAENSIFNVSFSMIDIDSYGDYLAIYDGSDINAPLIATVTGTSVPATLQQFYSSGPLTFYFNSDVSWSAAGWVANISSYSLKNKDLSLIRLGHPGILIAGDETDYPVTIQNLGISSVLGSSYTIQLIGDNDIVLTSVPGVDLTSMEEKTIMVPYTISDIGDYTIKAYISFTEDEDNSNNYSEEMIVKVQPAESEWVNIGAREANIGILPIAFFFTDSYSQTMFPASLIDKEEGKISILAYPVKSVNAYNGFQLKVWMGETERTDLSAGNISVNDLTLVYDGPSSMPATGGEVMEWIVTLDTPYEYAGKNLVVSTQKSVLGESDYEVQFFYTSNPDMVYAWCDTGYSGPVDPSTSGEVGFSNKSYPDINMLFIPNQVAGNKNSRTKSLNIYPNPISDFINISGITGEYEVSISDISGKLIMMDKINSNILDVSSLNPGIYILNIKLKDGSTFINKILKK